MAIKINLEIHSNGVIHRELNIKQNSTYKDLLCDLKINEETILVLKDDCPVPVDEVIQNGSTVKILKVVAGWK